MLFLLFNYLKMALLNSGIEFDLTWNIIFVHENDFWLPLCKWDALTESTGGSASYVQRGSERNIFFPSNLKFSMDETTRK